MSRRIIQLTEYEPKLLTNEEFSHEEGNRLFEKYSEIKVEFPSPVTNGQWRLTSEGWVGYMPVNSHLSINVLPKVPIKNLFRMFEYAYSLKSFQFLDSMAQLNSISEFYDNIAIVLSRRILYRIRKGIYREYRIKSEVVPYILGRIDYSELVRKPWEVNKLCEYEEHTADIQDNHILIWTLCIIARSGLCSERSIKEVRKAFRALFGFVPLVQCDVRDCINRQYNRLNNDYRLLHGLCRLFLENTGPEINIGNTIMLPFIVNMARLYELFVAEWLKVQLPAKYELLRQDRINVGKEGAISFNIDLVIVDAQSKEVLFVLDTKYKRDQSPSTSDFSVIG